MKLNMKHRAKMLNGMMRESKSAKEKKSMRWGGKKYQSTNERKKEYSAVSYFSLGLPGEAGKRN